MSRLAHCIIVFLLLSLSAQAATYYECLVLVSTNGGYASLVDPGKATPPSQYYYAHRADIPWGPSTVNYVTNSVTNSMVGYWTFETNSYGSSIYAGGVTQPTFSVWAGSNDLLVSGAAWNSASNGIYSFDRVDDSLSCTTVGNFSTSQAWSAEVWFNSTTIVTQAILDHSKTATPFTGWLLQYATTSGGRLEFYCLGTDASVKYAMIANSFSVASGWNQVTVTKSAGTNAASMELWVNAIRTQNIITDTLNSETTNSAAFAVGIRGAAASPNSPFGGYIGGTLLYNRKLIGMEITNRFNDSCAKYGKTKL